MKQVEQYLAWMCTRWMLAITVSCHHPSIVLSNLIIRLFLVFHDCVCCRCECDPVKALCLIINVSFGCLPRRRTDSSQSMCVFSFTWRCQSPLCRFTRAHALLGSSHFPTSTIIADNCLTTRFADLMDEKYHAAELMRWIRNNIFLWTWIFCNSLIEMQFTYCKIYPLCTIQWVSVYS